jgi:hypothetical protein
VSVVPTTLGTTTREDRSCGQPRSSMLYSASSRPG